MSWRPTGSTRWLAAAALLFTTGPAFGAGFSIFEQGTKAMGMAGAFTAQADDPSALFHNAGGLAFVTEGELQAGATYIRGLEAEFQGAAPFPGPSVTAEQEALSAVPPHAYYVAPISDTWKWGLGVTAPFGLVTEWKNEGTFAGRFLSTKAALEAVDINPTIGWQVTPSFGLGVGAIARLSTVELNRHIPFVNPFGNPLVLDVGRLKIESDGFAEGFGWNVGVLHKVTPRLSWGLSYRSAIEIEYEGEGRITQISTGNPTIDALLGTRIPFGTNLPVETAIDFPDLASFGVAVGVTPNVLVEVDVNRTGWSDFHEVVISGASPTAQGVFGPNATSPRGTVLPQEWEDSMHYRLGARWNTGPRTQVRVGYVFDETPQPEESMSPLLPDADRHGITFGYGSNGRGFNWDFAVMYLMFDERERTSTRSQNGLPVEPVFHGEYNTKALLLGLTIGWK